MCVALADVIALVVAQAQVNTMEGEVHQLKDNLLHQRKRAAENMMSLLKDLNEIGTMFSHDLDLKVRTRRSPQP